ncbi:MAG: hypothetical protein U5R31_08735 [Acidimicrobiia bacterium]|nr:hypothetical protein [Acidimicrobiia bacterium]
MRSRGPTARSTPPSAPHDWVHVLTDYDAVAVGEILVGGFMAANMHDDHHRLSPRRAHLPTGDRRASGTQSASEPAKICQASADFATRLSTR